MMTRNRCSFEGCNVTSARRIKENGYCDNHQNEANNDPLLQRLVEVEKENGTLREEVKLFKNILKTVCTELTNVYKHLNTVCSTVNCANYTSDEQEQYGRFESWRLNDHDEAPLISDEKGHLKDDEDCKETAIQAAELVGVTLTKDDIQRAHRVGRRRKPTAKNPNPAPRQLIVKLKDSDKRTNIILKKRSLQENAMKREVAKFSKAYIAEDLTPWRSKLLWYAKKKCDNKFVKCHTRNGKIKAKLASNPDSKEWLTIANPDDFFTHLGTGTSLDIDALNNGMRKYKIMKSFAIPDLSFDLE